MLARLERSFVAARRFSADAAHELRTPLTILKGEIEVALRAAEAPADIRRTLASCLEEVDRLNSLVEDLIPDGAHGRQCLKRTSKAGQPNRSAGRRRSGLELSWRQGPETYARSLRLRRCGSRAMTRCSFASFSISLRTRSSTRPAAAKSRSLSNSRTTRRFCRSRTTARESRPTPRAYF